LVFTALVASVRMKSWKMMLLMAPVLLNILPYAVFNGGHIARYILPTLIIGPLLTPYFLAIKPSKEPLGV